MTVKKIPLTVYSVQSAKPGTRYGVVSPLPISTSAEALFRAALDAIPANAVVSSAYADFYVAADATGTYTIQGSPITGAWSSATTWTTRPTAGAISASASQTNPKATSQVRLDFTTDVAARVAGTAVNDGWRVDTNGAKLTLRGTNASAQPPLLTITYHVPPDAPSDLHPSDASITTGSPVLTFTGPADMTSFTVLASATQNWAAPDFSTTVASGAGMLDLSTAAGWTALASGATTYFAIKVTNAAGDSPYAYSGAVTRAAVPTVTITSPPSGWAEDSTPTLTWSVTGGTQVAWHATFEDADTGKILDDSGYTPGTDTSWTPNAALPVGANGLLRLDVWDDQYRTATAGAPEYVEATVAVTYSLTATVVPLTTLAAAADGIAPDVYLTGTRAAVPDEVAIYRTVKDTTVLLDRLPGTDVFTGTTFGYTDQTVPLHRDLTYEVRCIEAGTGHSDHNPIAVVRGSCEGIWITDPDDGSRAVIWTGDDQDNVETEVSIVHLPVIPASGDGALTIKAVRRRLARYQKSGSISGTLIDVSTIAARDSEDALRGWIDNDAGHIYRLVLGEFSGPVTLGDIDLPESPLTDENERIVDVTLNWWGAS